MERRFAKDNIKNITTVDLLDALYGEIQSLVEAGAPDNVMFHYFLPPVPFGPELAAFLDVGRRVPPDGEEHREFTVQDMMLSAVNLAQMVDFVPTLGELPVATTSDGDGMVDLNSLISSGRSISDIYKAVLDNCRVVDNALSDQDKARLDKLRAVLYEDVEPAPDAPTSDTTTDDAEDAPTGDTDGDDPAAGASDDDLLAGLEDDTSDDDLLAGLDGDDGGDDDFNMDELFSDGVDTGDFLADADSLGKPTPVMQRYLALESFVDQVRATQTKRLESLSANNPRAGAIAADVRDKIRRAERRWEAQGKRSQVKAIIDRIEALSRSGMPGYLSDLKANLDAKKLQAALFITEDFGGTQLTDEAYYTALRPLGVLTAPTLMKVTLESSSSDTWTSLSETKTSGRMKLPIPSIPLMAKAGGEKMSKDAEREFFKEGFTISFEITQCIVDRDWFDTAFLESRAYTTVDPATGNALDAVNEEIVELSDGNVPAKGALAAIPQTAYFARNIKVQSHAFNKIDQEEVDKFSGQAGVSLFGFGASGKRTTSTTKVNASEAQTSGEIMMEGQFLIGLASRFLGKAPNPNFEDFPEPTDWV